VLKKLPVLFVCENNLYSVYSPLRVRQPEGRKIHEMVAAMGLPAEHGDGNDARAVHRAVSRGLEAIRAGQGPRFYEFATYRWREHCGPLYDNDLGYRTEAEFLEWKAREPIGRLTQALLAEKAATTSDFEQMKSDIDREVEAAFEFAERSPFPPAEDAFTHEYAKEAG
jgi:pyruvate dehydrogenase E1 component alpha subunit